jgi:uncharacterized membrane protein
MSGNCFGEQTVSTHGRKPGSRSGKSSNESRHGNDARHSNDQRQKSEKSSTGDPGEETEKALAQLDPSEKATIVAQVIEENPSLLERPEFSRLAVQIAQKSHSGPLPAPEDFAEYERALPGSCDRILRMAEKQQDYFYDINKTRITGDLNEARRGQVCAVLIAIVALGLCAWTCYIGADWRISAGLGGGGVALLIAPFLRRSK